MPSFDSFKNYVNHLSLYQIQVKLDDLTGQLREYFRHYPASSLVDLYKFIFQGTCGWSHLIHLSKDEVYENLFLEISRLTFLPNDLTPMVELLDETTQFARLHLRPWKKCCENQNELILKSMNNVLSQAPQDIALFRSRWDTILKLAKQEILTVEKKVNEMVLPWIELLLELTKDTDPVSILPAFHHTTMFREKYHPSYRIVYYSDFLENIES